MKYYGSGNEIKMADVVVTKSGVVLKSRFRTPSKLKVFVVDDQKSK